MGMRLYDTAWVELEGVQVPMQVFKDLKKPGMFSVGGFHYDIDGRALETEVGTPAIVRLLTLQSAKEAGLRLGSDV